MSDLRWVLHSSQNQNQSYQTQSPNPAPQDYGRTANLTVLIVSRINPVISQSPFFWNPAQQLQGFLFRIIVDYFQNLKSDSDSDRSVDIPLLPASVMLHRFSRVKSYSRSQCVLFLQRENIPWHITDSHDTSLVVVVCTEFDLI